MKNNNNFNRILKCIGSEFIYGGHLTALGAVSVVAASAIVLNIKISVDFLLIVYLIFYVIYLNNRSQQIKDYLLINSKRVRHFENCKIFIRFGTIIVLISEITLLYFSDFHKGSYNLSFGSLIFILGLCYRDFTENITNKIIGFRNFFVSLIWSLLVIFLISYYSHSFTLQVFLISVFVFLKMFSIQLFFDIIEIKNDKKNKLLTIPVVFGKHVSIYLLKFINILIILLVVCGIYFNVFYLFTTIIILSVFYSFYYINKIRNTNNDFRYFLFATAEPIFWLILILFGKFLSLHLVFFYSQVFYIVDKYIQDIFIPYGYIMLVI